MSLTSLWSQYRDELASDPLLILALSAALVALATTPIAFAVLGRLEWFKARRGRILLRPEFSSIVVRHDPGDGHPGDLRGDGAQEPVVRQGPIRIRPESDLVGAGAGQGVPGPQGGRRRRSGSRWSGWRWSGRTWSTTSRSWTKRCWRCGAWRARRRRWPQRFPTVLQSLAGVRKSVGLDGPQQLLDYTAPPVDLARSPPVRRRSARPSRPRRPGIGPLRPPRHPAMG